MSESLLHNELTSRILKAFYSVYTSLGYGFLEKVYENALMIELGKVGLRVTKQQAIKVFYDGHQVGDYFADLVVEGKVIIELKAAEAICEAHIAQLRNYLRATEIEVGMLLNFGPEPKFIRKVFSNETT